MIITNKFVMLNFPKTGSAFARKMLCQLYSKKKYTIFDKILFKLKLKNRPLFLIHEVPNIRDKSHKRDFMDEHGIYMQIPREHIHKKIISIKRDIYERYISIYEFRDWVKAPWIDEKILRSRYPSYPNITFNEFMEFIFEYNPMELLPQVHKKLPIGPATSQFILFFFKDPFKVFNEIDESYIKSDAYKTDMADIYFLDQKNLNQELYNFLIRHGQRKKNLKFILDAQKINNSTPKHKTKEDYFNQELYQLVNDKEELLFKILNYKPTN